MARSLVCGAQDPISRMHTCTLTEGHDGAHTDDTDPGRRWPQYAALRSHGIAR